MPTLGENTALSCSEKGSGVVRNSGNLIFRHFYTFRSDGNEKGRGIYLS
jgi:hypothetical protein